jgi:hypothetical protein
MGIYIYIYYIIILYYIILYIIYIYYFTFSHVDVDTLSAESPLIPCRTFRPWRLTSIDRGWFFCGTRNTAIYEKKGRG